MTNSKQQPSFYIHDYETFGTHPALDRPAQFAGVRTDMDFNIIEDPLVIYCQPNDDYLPHPEAVMITGITPQVALKNGVNEAEFTRQIHQAFSQPNSCIMGYNNLRFDDEVTRNILYRNFYDPYAYSWQKGNSRWDLMDVLRACYALRPEGINWPENEDGLPSFRLELLTKANNIAHENAHDAMSDVYATIAMAKKLKQAQPRMFEYFFNLRDKRKVQALIDIPAMTPIVHVSGMFGAWRSNLSLVAPLAWHPDNKNAVIVCDLAADISPLLHLNSEQLRERLYTPRSELADNEPPVPIKLLHINKCPIVAPQNTLRPQDADRIGLNVEQCLNNQATLFNHPEIRNKVVEIFAQQAPFVAPDNVDAQLYNGFFSENDRSAMEIIRATQPQNLPALDLTFEDPRMEPLFFRYRARNYPSTLNYEEQQRWLAHRKANLTAEKLTDYINTIQLLAEEHSDNPEKLKQLQALYLYAQEIAS